MRSPACLALCFLLLAAPAGARAEEVTVMISGGYLSSFRALLPGFEAATGDRVNVIEGPSMGVVAEAIPQRLARGEPDDVLIMVGTALDALVAEGRAVVGSRVDLALSPIGVAVKAGAPVPDISTPEKLRAALLAAKSVAYSDGASGAYVKGELFRKLGIEAEMRDRTRMIPAMPIGEIVARGGAEIGFQQMADLLPVGGITVVGKLPDAVQKITVYAAGVAAKAEHPAAARALIRYLASATAALALERTGLEPVRR